MKFLSTEYRSVLCSEGTLEISQLRSGWCAAKKKLQVPKGRGEFFNSAVLSGRKIFPSVFQPLRSWLISGCRFATQFAVAVVISFSTLVATAQTTNGLSDAGIQGQQLAQQIIESLAQRPAENAETKAIMQIRDQGGHHSEVPIVCRIVVTVSMANTNIIIPDWQTLYKAAWTNKAEYLWVTHTSSLTNAYSYSTVPVRGDIPIIGHFFGSHQISGQALMSPFAGSDFWIADLGLEFFHWPDQKVIKHESRRARACAVLESTNPNPAPGAYSRVDSWIDNETLGVVHAEAFDANGKLLKVFDPKSFKKVNGQWELQDMDIRNVQTGSRTRIEFDLKTNSGATS